MLKQQLGGKLAEPQSVADWDEFRAITFSYSTWIGIVMLGRNRFIYSSNRQPIAPSLLPFLKTNWNVPSGYTTYIHPTRNHVKHPLGYSTKPNRSYNSLCQFKPPPPPPKPKPPKNYYYSNYYNYY